MGETLLIVSPGNFFGSRNQDRFWIDYTDLLQVRKTIRPTVLRPSLVPGSVLIVLAGRFRGKRVVYLKSLGNGVLLVTGPFKINGVPLRRVNARYVIATSTSVDLAGVNVEKFDEKYFAREKEAKKTKEEQFYEGGKKAEVRFPGLFWETFRGELVLIRCW